MTRNTSQWITPFKRQCFVSLGVSLNVCSYGLAIGFPAVLLPQLRRPDSAVPIDEASGSWIASILGFALIAGNLILPNIMARSGRKVANIVSILPLFAGWFCTIYADSVMTHLIARFLIGISVGMSMSLGPVLIGEYTSPNYRGAFLTTTSLAIATGVLTVHTLGLFLGYQKTALVCIFIAFVDLLIVINSPESPCWLADQGRYDECKKTYRLLRGDNEEQELKALIETSKIIREAKQEANITQSFKKNINNFFNDYKVMLQRKEFYKPVFIMMHVYTMGAWGGANVVSAYVVDILYILVGTDANIPLLTITLGVQRILSNLIAVIMFKKIKRKTMIYLTVGINLFSLLLIAAYTYAKATNKLPFEHPMIGVTLMHVHMFSLATGMVPLPLIIAGEVFPLECKSEASAITVPLFSIYLFLAVKTAPGLFSSIGLYGAYLLYASIVGYCLVVTGLLLPETKDRTLQEIEEEFRGKPFTVEELKSARSLTSMQYNLDRRCSHPIFE